MQDAQFSDEQWWALCDCNAAHPVPLADADLTRPFVYERKWGVFYVPGGYHPLMMATLLAFQHGLTCAVDAMKILGLRESGDAADYWLEHTQGAAFRSSVGRKIQVAKLSSLSIHERRLFGDVACVFD